MIVRKLLFVIVAVYVCSAEPVKFITKCSTTDSACLKKSSQAAIPAFIAGLPEYNVESLDPLHLDKVDGSNTDLKFITTDVTITGLKDCIIENVKFYNGHTDLNITTLCDVTYKSLYEVTGRVLIVPFEGKGDLLAELNKLRLRMHSTLGKKLDKQGRKHFTIKKYEYTYEFNGKSKLEMTHLFDGNEVLSRAAHELIATNSNEVILEICPPIIKTIVEKVLKAIGQFLRSVPEEDLVLD